MPLELHWVVLGFTTGYYWEYKMGNGKYVNINKNLIGQLPSHAHFMRSLKIREKSYFKTLFDGEL
jgi:hypothetical protein